MNGNHRDELRRAMQEVAALPPGHPQREQTMRQIEKAGPWARNEWIELLKQDEQRRMELRDVKPPAGLAQRLKAIPDQAAARTTRDRRIRRRTVGMLAAACLLLIGLVGISLRPNEPDLEQVTQELVRLAMQDHIKRPELTVASSQAYRVESNLQGKVAFPVRVPSMDASMSLVGGRVCAFDRRPIVYTRWQSNGKEHSLYQLRAVDFNLPDQFLPMKFTVPAVPDHPQQYDVLIWSAGQCAYVMVCEEPIPLGPLPAQAERGSTKKIWPRT